MQLVEQRTKLPLVDDHLGGNARDACKLAAESRYKRHGKLLPAHVRLICVGPSNCGKTSALLSLIFGREGLSLENLYIFSKSLNQPKYRQLEAVLKKVPEIGFFKFSSVDSVPPLDEVRKNSVMIFDDVGSEPGKNRHLQAYFSMGRHKHVDIVFLNQSYANIYKHLVRENANLILIFKQDLSSLKHIFEDHVAPDMKFDKFCEMCSLAWS